MQKPLEIKFHGLERSEAIEQHIAERAAKLEKRFDRMTHCRVVIDAPHRNPAKSVKGTVYNVRIEVGIPGHNPVLVNHERADDHDYDDIKLAIRDAFAAAQRQVDDLSKKLAATQKTESKRRKPSTKRED